MACHLFSTEPSPEPIQTYYQLGLQEKSLWNLNLTTKSVFQEYDFENDVCKMVAILLRPQCVNGEPTGMILTTWHKQLPYFFIDINHNS